MVEPSFYISSYLRLKNLFKTAKRSCMAEAITVVFLHKSAINYTEHDPRQIKSSNPDKEKARSPKRQ